MKIDLKGPIVGDADAWVYDFFGIPCISPAKVNKALADANGASVDVYINSSGGSVFAGSEIFSAIREYSGTVKIHVVGLAASAASVVACAGPSDITPTAMLMVHNVSSGGAAGDYHVKDQESRMLKKANEAIAAAYVEKTGMSQKEALALMDKTTWLTAEDAVKYGLIDEIAQPAQPAENTLTASMGGVLPPEAIQKVTNMLKAPDTAKWRAQMELLKLKGAML